MPGYGDQNADFTVRAHVEGIGELAQLDKAMEGIREKRKALREEIASGKLSPEDIASKVAEYNKWGRSLEQIKTAAASVDPIIASMNATVRDGVQAMKESEEQTRKLAAAKREMFQETLAAAMLAIQKQEAIEKQAFDERNRILAEEIAKSALAAQKKDEIAQQEVDQRKAHIERLLAALALATQKEIALAQNAADAKQALIERNLAALALATQKEETLAQNEADAKQALIERNLAALALATQKEETLAQNAADEKQALIERNLAAYALSIQKEETLAQDAAEKKADILAKDIAAAMLAGQKREELAANAVEADRERTAIYAADITRRNAEIDEADAQVAQKKKDRQAEDIARAILNSQKKDEMAKASAELQAAAMATVVELEERDNKAKEKFRANLQAQRNEVIQAAQTQTLYTHALDEGLLSSTRYETKFSGIIGKLKQFWEEEKKAASAINEVAAAMDRQKTGLPMSMSAYGDLPNKEVLPWHGFGAAQRERQANLKEQVRAERDLALAQESAIERQKRHGYAILHVSHAMQDLTYGIGAVINNIPLMVQSFGGTPALAGKAMLIGVAFDVIWRNMGKVKELITGMSPVYVTHVEKMKAAVDELNGSWITGSNLIPLNQQKTAELAQATRDLKRAEEAEKLAAAPSEEEIARKRAYEEAARKGGGGRKVSDMLSQLFTSEFSAADMVAIKKAVEGKQLTSDAARGVTTDTVIKTMQESPAIYQELREKWLAIALPKMVAEMMTRLASGETAAHQEVLSKTGGTLKRSWREVGGMDVPVSGYVGGHDILGAREGSDLTNKFLRALEENQPEAIKARKAQEELTKAWEHEAEEVVKDQETRRNKAKETQEKLDAVQKTAFDAQVSLLVSGKQKVFEEKYTMDFLELIKQGKTREQILGVMTRKLEADIGDVEGAKIASEQLASKVMEKAFGLTVPFIGGPKGVKQPVAAAQAMGVLAREQTEAEEKAALKEGTAEAKAEKARDLARIARFMYQTFVDDFGQHMLTQAQAVALAPRVLAHKGVMGLEQAAMQEFGEMRNELNKSLGFIQRGGQPLRRGRGGGRVGGAGARAGGLGGGGGGLGGSGGGLGGGGLGGGGFQMPFMQPAAFDWDDLAFPEAMRRPRGRSRRDILLRPGGGKTQEEVLRPGGGRTTEQILRPGGGRTREQILRPGGPPGINTNVMQMHVLEKSTDIQAMLANANRQLQSNMRRLEAKQKGIQMKLDMDARLMQRLAQQRNPLMPTLPPGGRGG